MEYAVYGVTKYLEMNFVQEENITKIGLIIGGGAKEEMNFGIYANAVLKDGKLLFWWTGDKCKSVEDFYKDFLYSGLKMMEEIKNFEYELKVKQVDSFEDGKEFYKQFPLHEEYKGAKPY